MYESFYNLAYSPFENTADPRFFFAGEQHREALAAIEYTVRLRKGLVLITGEPGSGKTTVANTLCERLGADAQFVCLSHAHQTRDLLMRQLSIALNTTAELGDDHVAIVNTLRQRMVEQMHNRRPLVLLIDEAQALSDGALEELRLIMNLDTTQQKLAQIVLIGQPELRDRVGEAQHTSLRQRIFLSRRISAFTVEQTTGYIQHRIRLACSSPGDPTVSFTPGAFREIHRLTGGVARLINAACDNCLLLGSVRRVKEISTQIVHDVAADMVPRFDTPAIQAHREQPDLSLAGNF